MDWCNSWKPFCLFPTMLLCILAILYPAQEFQLGVSQLQCIHLDPDKRSKPTFCHRHVISFKFWFFPFKRSILKGFRSPYDRPQQKYREKYCRQKRATPINKAICSFLLLIRKKGVCPLENLPFRFSFPLKPLWHYDLAIPAKSHDTCLLTTYYLMNSARAVSSHSYLLDDATTHAPCTLRKSIMLK